MSKRFSGDIGDFKPKKPKKINEYRPSTRFSFRLSGDTPKPDNNCGEISVPRRQYDFNDSAVKPGRSPGEAVLYSPDQIDNYKRSYPRFERALDLITDSADYGEQSAEFAFCTDASPTGYWVVKATSGAPDYFVDAGKPLQIICPRPYVISTVTTNSRLLHWEQLAGGRLVIVDTEENSLQPELIILDDTRSPQPIRLLITTDEDEDANDILTVYTTPTSTWGDGMGFQQQLSGSDIAPSREIPAFVAPFPALRSTIGAGLSSGYTWRIPVNESSYIVQYVVQQNIGGTYQDVAYFDKDDLLSFSFTINQNYRIKVLRDTFGYISTSDSFRIYFDSIPPIVSAKDLFSSGSFSGTTSSTNVLPLDRAVFNPKSAYDNPVSFSGSRSLITTLPLDRATYIAESMFISPISFSGTKSSIVSIDLGGVVIQ